MIRTIVGDLATVEVDAIVRPTTTTLAPASENLTTVERAAGPGLADHTTVRQALALGSAIVTGSGDLNIDFIIHAVIMEGTAPVTAKTIRRAVLSALQRASDWQFGRVAFPPLGAEAGHLVTEATAGIMTDVIIQYLKEQQWPTDVLIVVGNNEEKTIFDAHLASSTS